MTDDDDVYRGNYNPWATDKQVAYVRQLCKEARLFKDDFPTPETFYKKTTLTVAQADKLIKLVLDRRKKEREEQAIRRFEATVRKG